jgi:hypothetical protein
LRSGAGRSAATAGTAASNTPSKVTVKRRLIIGNLLIESTQGAAVCERT